MTTGTSRPQRIFISYGHDEHAALAARVKNDLLARHHEVWVDSDHLKPGTPDWEHSIDRGIEWVQGDARGRMVFLVTPHSARRPDGFCLNELSRALEKRIGIIPVMVVWCELPLSICRIQWLDMRDSVPLTEREDRYEAGLARLCEAIEHDRIDLEGTQARLLNLLEPDMLTFDADIESHLADFEGRDWLKEAVDTWLADPASSRLFWLTGRPGSGKSAFASWLCANRREIASRFLCSFDNALKSDPRRCVLSMACQLSTQLSEYQSRLSAMNLEEIVRHPDALTLFEELVANPLSYNFPAPDRKVVALIDALDEATRDGRNRIAEFLAKCLEKTPGWFKLLVTSRPDQEVLHPLQAFSPVELDTFSEQNEADIRAYLAKHLPEADEETIREISQKSDGIFLYARYVLHEIRQGRLSLDRLDAFPRGLGGCYARFFERRFPLDGPSGQPGERFKGVARPLLEIMAAARKPLRLEYAAKVLGWDDYDALDHVGLFGSLLTSSDGTLRPFHRTLMEWSTEKTTAGKYFSSMDKGHARLAEAGWREYQAGFARMDEYPRDHLAAHLVAARRWEDAKTFLADPAVMARMMEEERRYELLGVWLAIGDRLDMARVYAEAIAAFEQSGRAGEEIADLCQKTSKFFESAANYPDALLLAQKGLSIRESLPGKPLLDIAHSTNGVARIFWFMGRYREAEPLNRRAMEIQEEQLGDDNPEFARSLNAFGALLASTGKSKEATHSFRRALAIREKALGPEHPDVAMSLNNLACLLLDNGETAVAEPMYRRALAIREKTQGPDHPDLAPSLNNLAVLLNRRGDSAAAEPMYRRALDITEKALGPKHPDVALSLDNLARLMFDKGDIDAAESIYRRALAIWEKTLGSDHPHVAFSLNSLANLLSDNGDSAAAEPLYRRALAIQEKALGPEHPTVARALETLPVLLHRAGTYEEAESLYRRALVIYQHTRGEEHQDTMHCKNNLDLLLQAIVSHFSPENPVPFSNEHRSPLQFTTLEGQTARDVINLVAPLIAPASFPEDKIVVRSAPLPFYDGVTFYSLSDTTLPEHNTRYIFQGPSSQIILHNWTNETIYALNESCPIILNRETIVLYICFFFHYVRSESGRFIFAQEPQDVLWLPDATKEEKSEVESQLMSVTYHGLDPDGMHILLGTAIFLNNLYKITLKVASKEIELTDEETGLPREFKVGQIVLFVDELLMEEIAVQIPPLPSEFG